MSSYDPADFSGTPFTPVFARYNLSGRWLAWDRYHTPGVFAGTEAELEAVAEAAVLEDKTPMTKYYISGPDATAFLDHLMTRDATKIELDHALFTAWCNEQGKLIEELPVFRLGETLYCTTGIRMEGWFRKHTDGFDVEISDVSADIGVLPCQGPSSRAVLEAATGEDWSDLRFARGRDTEIAGVDVRVWRLGYTGSLGYELFVPAEGAVAVLERMLEVGEPFGIQPWGQLAVHATRVAAGFLCPGVDYLSAEPTTQVAVYDTEDDEAIMSPYEVGLHRFVDLDKETDFVGKQALLEEQAAGGPPRTLVGLEVDWHDIVATYDRAGTPPEDCRRIRWERLPVLRDGERVGSASSVVWNSYLGRMIGFGQVGRAVADLGNRFDIVWNEAGDLVGATVVEVPFRSRREMYSG
jgi:aminomethyltransferase